MDVQERIRLSLVLEEMKKNGDTAGRLGLTDASHMKHQKQNIIGKCSVK